MNLKSFFLWSTVLSIPLLFLPKKKQPGVVVPGPETTTNEGEPVVTEPSDPPEPLP